MVWQKILSNGFASSKEVLEFLGLPTTLSNMHAERQFKTRVPRGFVARMQHHNPNDPLLLQVLASEEELLYLDEYQDDPLQENKFNPLPGLIHKYYGRVLVILTGVCAINCRYCFRRHFAYQDNNPGRQGWMQVFDYIQHDQSITEVILSGGDPLLMPDIILTEFLTQLITIDHIKTIRLHTRIPIVLPERIDAGLLQILSNIHKNKVIVLHCNHPQEINAEVQEACFALHNSGCHLLNQTVFLNKINNDAKILAMLSETLFDCKVLPYYLHLLDKVNGAMHFDIPETEVMQIYHQLQSMLPGYLVPRLVREVPNKKYKIFLHK